jgi:hypothetical protein
MQVELHAAMRNLATCNAMRARRDHAIHARRNLFATCNAMRTQ